jgi:protein arginine kinase
LRLGADLRLMENPPSYRALNELVVLSRPASLQKMAGKILSAGERDAARAKFLRQKLKEAGNPGK